MTGVQTCALPISIYYEGGLARTSERFKTICILYKSMIFKEVYTTAAIKAAIIADKYATSEEKEKENKKIEVSEDAFLNAIMQQELIIKINQLMARIK